MVAEESAGVQCGMQAEVIAPAKDLGGEHGLGFAVLVFGLAALAFAETAAAELLLAGFVAGIVLVWAAQMLHHSGLFARPPTALPHG